MLETTPCNESPSDPSASHVALRSLFDQEESDLLRFTFSLVGRREVAEEIVQDVFLGLHQRWEDVDSPRAWLFRSARNRALNFLRDHRREMITDIASNDPENNRDETPEIFAQRVELLAALRGMVDDLSDVDQELVKLKYFEGLKYRQISERTGMTVGNVGYRLHHILKRLADRLRPLGIEEIA